MLMIELQWKTDIFHSFKVDCYDFVIEIYNYIQYMCLDELQQI